MRYPKGFVPPPKQIPVGAILVHNPVTAIHPQQSHGWNGFRFFYMTAQAAKDKHVVRCRCGWAPHLPVHYHPKGHMPARHVTNARVRRSRSLRSGKGNHVLDHAAQEIEVFPCEFQLVQRTGRPSPRTADPNSSVSGKSSSLIAQTV